MMAQAVQRFRHDRSEQQRDVAFELIEAPFGAGAYFDHGKAFPEDTKKVCDEADAILKGPVGSETIEASQEDSGRGAGGARSDPAACGLGYDTFTDSVRCLSSSKDMAHFSPLKPEIIQGRHSTFC
ncbi:MAG: hypothetical protein U5O39_16750 [Gammaproteobacteria bacterium]|nr:hypothetical protein [Gammaproteobacteria bacterium]